MSAHEKLMSGRNSELTRLKEKWRTLDESTQDYWREQFISSRPHKDVLEEIHTKLKIKLIYNNQLLRFRKWLEEQEELSLEAERMAEDERRLIAEFGDSQSMDKIRETVLRRSYARMLARGDFQLGLRTMSLDQNERKLKLQAKQADATDKVLADAQLSPEEREQRIKEIYGRA